MFFKVSFIVVVAISCFLGVGVLSIFFGGQNIIDEVIQTEYPELIESNPELLVQIQSLFPIIIFLAASLTFGPLFLIIISYIIAIRKPGTHLNALFKVGLIFDIVLYAFVIVDFSFDLTWIIAFVFVVLSSYLLYRRKYEIIKPLTTEPVETPDNNIENPFEQ
ncbi:MAG: hypothetical protein LBV58_04610 [Acholeplasmatales bacterium]|jgi:hypothetical protein|nr:hypothetical protein [Acholeplasmatales bacterium]